MPSQPSTRNHSHPNSSPAPEFGHPELETVDHATLWAYLSEHPSVQTSIDLAEIQNGPNNSLTGVHLPNLSHEGLTSHLKNNGESRLRILFLNEVALDTLHRPPSSFRDIQVSLHPETVDYLVTALGVCPMFLSSLVSTHWLLNTGNGLFKKYVHESSGVGNDKLACIEGLFRYSRETEGQPAHVWFSHDLERGTSTYVLHNCSASIKLAVSKWVTESAGQILLMRPLALETLIMDEVAWSWSQGVVNASKKLLRYEHLKPEHHSAIKLNDAVYDLHNLSQHFHVLDEELNGIVEKLDYLAALHPLLPAHAQSYSAVAQSSSGRRYKTSTIDSILFLRSRTQIWHRWVRNWRERTNVRINLFLNLTAQRDSGTNSEIAVATADIAEETRKDSSSMITIAALTLVFLPGTFIATLLGMPFFDASSGKMVVSNRLWIFFAVSIPFTLMIWNAWRMWRNWRNRSFRNFRLSAKEPEEGQNRDYYGRADEKGSVPERDFGMLPVTTEISSATLTRDENQRYPIPDLTRNRPVAARTREVPDLSTTQGLRSAGESSYIAPRRRANSNHSCLTDFNADDGDNPSGGRRQSDEQMRAAQVPNCSPSSEAFFGTLASPPGASPGSGPIQGPARPPSRSSQTPSAVVVSSGTDAFQDGQSTAVGEQRGEGAGTAGSGLPVAPDFRLSSNFAMSRGIVFNSGTSILSEGVRSLDLQMPHSSNRAPMDIPVEIVDQIFDHIISPEPTSFRGLQIAFVSRSYYEKFNPFILRLRTRILNQAINNNELRTVITSADPSGFQSHSLGTSGPHLTTLKLTTRSFRDTDTLWSIHNFLVSQPDGCSHLKEARLTIMVDSYSIWLRVTGSDSPLDVPPSAQQVIWARVLKILDLCTGVDGADVFLDLCRYWHATSLPSIFEAVQALVEQQRAPKGASHPILITGAESKTPTFQLTGVHVNFRETRPQFKHEICEDGKCLESKGDLAFHRTTAVQRPRRPPLKANTIQQLADTEFIRSTLLPESHVPTSQERQLECRGGGLTSMRLDDAILLPGLWYHLDTFVHSSSHTLTSLRISRCTLSKDDWFAMLSQWRFECLTDFIIEDERITLPTIVCFLQHNPSITSLTILGRFSSISSAGLCRKWPGASHQVGIKEFVSSPGVVRAFLEEPMSVHFPYLQSLTINEEQGRRPHADTLNQSSTRGLVDTTAIPSFIPAQAPSLQALNVRLECRDAHHFKNWLVSPSPKLRKGVPARLAGLRRVTTLRISVHDTEGCRAPISSEDGCIVPDFVNVDPLDVFRAISALPALEAVIFEGLFRSVGGT
ncbi:hypothetical protein DFP72DRAFT_1054673 [Ephemerocybe angulata]|uniref:Uncharacterized protein n=1 Tax=Ephemerocybe angulata TaxID=980116 RepID=A0A8H6H973_9AGAR|nr:hypothetical protein DFP72DRAFT_1054673 [Tulosesus angulatus]